MMDSDLRELVGQRAFSERHGCECVIDEVIIYPHPSSRVDLAVQMLGGGEALRGERLEVPLRDVMVLP